jgi:SNF2 family DNA or RNA helicase
VIILGPRAAGLGLTLTAANHVVHLSRWWNPAVEDQCTDRVYRIGQDRPVIVHIPQAIYPENPESSFDRRLHELLQKKRALSRDLLAPPAAGEQEVRELYEATIGSADEGR